MTPAACAVVVTYHPDGGFPARLAAALASCERAVVVDNGSDPAAVRRWTGDRVHLIENGTNQGLATALNQGCRAAAALGYRWAVTLDQDTHPLPNLCDALFAALAAHPSPHRVGLVGSAPVAADGRRIYPGGSGPFVPVPYAVTAGSLTRLAAVERIGGFRDRLFIDSIDRDLCYRLRAAGYHVVRARTPGVRHEWGTPTVVRIGPLAVARTNHSPGRRYTITRNWLRVMAEAVVRQPGLLPAEGYAMGLDTLLAVALEPDRRRKLAAVLRGAFDAARCREGPA